MSRKLAVSALVLFSSAALAAEVVSVTYNGETGGVGLTITGHAGGNIGTAAGTMNLTVDGDSVEGYCVDLDHHIYNGLTYDAEVVPMYGESPWCEVAYVLDNYDTATTSGAAIQTALWKLVYSDEPIAVSNSTVEAAANAIVADAQGACPLSCVEDVEFDFTVTPTSDGTLVFDTLITRDGAAASGVAIDATVDGGAIVSADDETDADGYVTVQVSPTGAADDVTLTLASDGVTVYRLEPTTTSTQMLTFLSSDTCTWTDDAGYSSTAFGQPRTIGFWKHQASTALGGKGHNHVDYDTLDSWVPFTVFGTELSSVQDLYDVLWLKNASMDERALQQCTASYLNLAWGEVGWFTNVDLDQDGVDDGYFYELWNDAADAYVAGDYETAKDICDTFNNL